MEFIREQIKEKPMNRKKIAKKLGLAALCGVVFAVAACVVVLIFLPGMKAVMGAGNTEPAGPIETESESEPESEGKTTESESESETGTEEPGDTEIEIPDISLSIDDYQELQNELYQIGNIANKSIVTIKTLVSETDWMNNAYETEGQGAGVIISEDADYFYVLTEKKIIPEDSRVHVTFIDDTSAEATLLKYDGNTGVAILAVEKRQVENRTKDLVVVAQMGNSFAVTNGCIVIALGSPLGSNYSILTGNITSTNNEISTIDMNYSVFTTDIVASEKASGILINTKGEIIGMVIQDFSGSQDMNTLTAVAISEIGGNIERLTAGKDIPYVGLYVSTVTSQISKNYDIPMGVFIKDVLTDSPAMFAGLQSGDIITHINGEEINTDSMYSTKIRMLLPGTTCEITVRRQSGEEYIEVKCEVEIGILQ